jgi:hypothetical protein
MQDRMITFHQVTIGYPRAIPIHIGTGIQATTTVGIQAIIIHTITTTIPQATTTTHTVTIIRTLIGITIGIRTTTMAITGGIGDLTGDSH